MDQAPNRLTPAPPAPVADPLQMAPGADRAGLLARARIHFQSGERIEVKRLAAELGVSRATAYRRLGNNEAVLADVLTALTIETFNRSMQQAEGTGRDLVLSFSHLFLHRIAGSTPFQSFLAREPELALTLVASRAYPIQRTVIALVQDLLESEIARGQLRLPVDARTMAYAMVRVFESFLYRDIVVGERVDIHDAVDVVALLLPTGPKQ